MGSFRDHGNSTKGWVGEETPKGLRTNESFAEMFVAVESGTTASFGIVEMDRAQELAAKDVVEIPP